MLVLCLELGQTALDRDNEGQAPYTHSRATWLTEWMV